MKSEPESTFEVTLTGMAYGGEAVGRLPDGRVVFVPFALPGERVLLQPVEQKRGFVRARLLEILEPSPMRISPRCAHFAACGGCHYQHMSYEAQLALKAGLLREQLQRTGGIPHPPVLPAVPCPFPWNYRNDIQFHLAGDGKLGFQAAGSHTIIPIRECHLPEPALNELWPLLDFEPDPGLERIGLRSGVGDEILLTLEGNLPEPPEFTTQLPVSAVYLAEDRRVVLAGDEALTMEVLGRHFRVSAGSFFQVNTSMATAMVQHLVERLPLSRNATLMDIYCGVGLFSAFLAGRAARLIGVEISPTACEDFAANLEEFDNVELYQGAAEDILPALDARPDIALVDPPRAGLAPRSLEALLRLHPPFLAYVSCDPATLARDARRLISGGYRLVQSTPFDLFPQTYHIESINLFSLAP